MYIIIIYYPELIDAEWPHVAVVSFKCIGVFFNSDDRRQIDDDRRQGDNRRQLDDWRQGNNRRKVTTGGKVTTDGKVTTQQLVRSLAAWAIATGKPRTTDSVLDMRFVAGVIKNKVCRRTFSIIGKVSIAKN